jgi:MFS family permease
MRPQSISAGNTGEKPTRAPAYAWLVLAVVFLVSVIGPLNQFKVPPVMPDLIRNYSLSMTSAGLLMSVFSIAGCILALPTGFILQKIGLWGTGVLSALCILIGSIWGIQSGSQGMLLLSRIFEGAGMAIIGVAAPVAISLWFPRTQRGIALGIWSAWVSVGVTVMMNSAPLLTAGGNWKSIWWFGAIFAAVALALYALFFRNPRIAYADNPPQDPDMTMREQLAAVLGMRDVWLVCIALFGFNVVILSMGAFLPTFLMQVHHMNPQEAGFYSSLTNITLIATCPLGGWLAWKTGRLKTIFSTGLLVIGAWWAVAFSLPGNWIPLSMIILGFAAGPVVTTIVTSMPEVVKKPMLFGFGLAVMQFAHHLGEFVGPVLFGFLLDNLQSWQTAGLCMVPLCLIAGVAGFMMRVR